MVCTLALSFFLLLPKPNAPRCHDGRAERGADRPRRRTRPAATPPAGGEPHAAVRLARHGVLADRSAPPPFWIGPAMFCAVPPSSVIQVALLVTSWPASSAVAPDRTASACPATA